MEITYDFLYQQQNKEALQKLFQAKFDGATTYNVRKIMYQCEKHFKQMQKDFQALVKQYAELDEKGDVKPVEGQPVGTFNIKADKAQEWNTAIQELMNKKIPFEKCDKIHVNQLVNSDMKLSSMEMQSLEPLLDGLDFEG